MAAGCAAPEVPATSTSIAAEPWSGPPPKAPVLFPARQDNKWGYIDKTGRLVVDFQYDEAWDFSDGMAAVRVGGKWGYVDESGKTAIAPQFSDGSDFSDDRAQVSTPTGIGYIDKTGKLVIPPNPEWLGGFQFSEGLAGVPLQKGYGFIDTAGKLVFRLPDATSVGYFSEGLATVREWEATGYIDRSGTFVIEPRFTYGSEFSNGLAMVEYGLGRSKRPRPVKWCTSSDAPSSSSTRQLAMSSGTTSSWVSAVMAAGSMALASDSALM
jgi:hypothetical protein